MFSNGHFNCTKRQNKEFNHQSKEGCQAQAEGQNQLVPLSALALPSQWVLQVLNIECGRREKIFSPILRRYNSQILRSTWSTWTTTSTRGASSTWDWAREFLGDHCRNSTNINVIITNPPKSPFSWSLPHLLTFSKILNDTLQMSINSDRSSATSSYREPSPPRLFLFICDFFWL